MFFGSRTAPDGGVAVLPEALRPYTCNDLVRLGADMDGGYVLDLRSVMAAKYLLSCGVNEDWSFEEDFCRRNPVPVTALDGSVGDAYFKDRIRSAMTTPWKLLWHIGVYRSYKKFYSGGRKHLQQFVGTAMPGGKSLAAIIREHVPAAATPLFIKMDIEGSEYEVLDEVIATASTLTGLIIEFHDVDARHDQIVDFTSRLPLRLCHVHINNNGGVSDKRVPRVIECSYSQFCGPARTSTKLPLQLDRACWYKIPDYTLRFE